MKYHSNFKILIDRSKNIQEFVIDPDESRVHRHTCVCYVDQPQSGASTLQGKGKTSAGSSNMFISCKYINTESVLTSTSCISPRVVVGAPTILGERELYSGINSYELVSNGWIEESSFEESDEDVEVIPRMRKGTLNLDDDIDYVINKNSAAVVSVGKIKVMF